MAEKRSSTPVKRPWLLGVLFGIAAVLVRVPFAFRYDLHFQSDSAIMYLMAKRVLKGEFSFYFWNQEYYGTLVQLLTALVLAVFGSSIVIATLVTAVMYGLTVAIGTTYVSRYFGKLCGVGAGVVMAIGVPFMHHYTSMPADSAYTFSIMAAVILVFWGAGAVSQPVTVRRMGVFGFALGLGWYLDKHVLVAAAAIGLTYLITARGRVLLKSLFRSELLAVFGIAFLVGYSPELIYKVTQKVRPPHPLALLSLASPEQVVQNTYWAGRGALAYFDGDPMSRTPEGVHYLQRNENVDSLPVSVADWLGVLAAAIVWLGALYFGIRAWRAQDHPQLLLAVYPFVNVALVIFAGVSQAAYYSARRYLFSASIFLFMWWGICIVRGMKQKRGWALSAVLSLVLVLSVVHQVIMLQLPDELKDYRSVAAELDKLGIHYAISWYSISHVMTALTNEKTVFATIDYGGYKVYQDEVLRQDQIGLVYPTRSGVPPEKVSIQQRAFVRTSPPSVHGELSLVVYQYAP